MKRHLSIIVTSMSFVLAGVPGLRVAAAAQEMGSEEPDDLPKRLFREQRYLEAAEAFEELWRAKQIPKGLFNAAMAREMMGHELHAFVLLREYLGIPGLAEPERAKAQDRLRVLQERAPRLRVTVSPADISVTRLDLHVRRGAIDPGRAEIHLDGPALGALAAPDEPGAYDVPAEPGPWSLELTASGYAPGRASVTVAREQVNHATLKLEPPTGATPVTAHFIPEQAVRAGIDVSLRVVESGAETFAGEHTERVQHSQATWHLAPGAWILEANSPGFRPARQSFNVGPEQLSLQVQLSPSRDGARGHPLTLGLGVAAGVMAVAGAVTLGVSGARWGRSREGLLDATGTYRAGPTLENEAAWEAASGRLASNWLSANGGAGMLGAGLGLGLGSVTSVAPRRKSVWAAEVAIGAALGVGAFVAYSYTVGGLGLRLEKIRHGADGTESWDDQSKKAASDSINRGRTEGLVSSLFVGVGAGLLVSGIVGLIHGRRPSPGLARTSISPYSGRHGSGVVLKLQF